jgi:uncharacterized protein (DUF1330 family)
MRRGKNIMKRSFAVVVAVLAGFAVGAAVVQGVHAQAKPPAYTIAEIAVTDPATFQKDAEGSRDGILAAGGRFVVRGGKTFVINGAPPKPIVVIQWDSLEKAQAYFESEAYKQLIPVRDRSANFRAFVIEGLTP